MTSIISGHKIDTLDHIQSDNGLGSSQKLSLKNFILIQTGNLSLNFQVAKVDFTHQCFERSSFINSCQLIWINLCKLFFHHFWTDFLPQRCHCDGLNLVDQVFDYRLPFGEEFDLLLFLFNIDGTFEIAGYALCRKLSTFILMCDFESTEKPSFLDSTRLASLDLKSVERRLYREDFSVLL